MATNEIAYLYQLQNMDYSTLSNTNFKIAVVDDDSAGLNSIQINNLDASGKMVMGYLSIGEAESYRNYWDSSWDNNPPDWIIGQNPIWGSYYVKFWEPQWQDMIIGKAVALAQEGYGGMVMDVVDIYTVAAVQDSYNGATSARDEMIKFVGRISDAVKSVNPNFKVVTNNGMDLVTTNGSPTAPLNSSYLSKIDGINAESTFYLSDNSTPSWSAWNLQYLDLFVDAGKVVFSIDYPTNEATQQAYMDAAISHGFVPFIGNTLLSQLDSTNYQILDKLPYGLIESFTNNDSGTTPTPTPSNDNVINGSGNADAINGINTRDQIYANDGNDTIHGNGGVDYIEGGNGNDLIYGDAESDYIFGGNGNDRLIGGAADDGLTGGEGSDKFVFFKNGGNDWLNDFSQSDGDVIQIASDIYSTAEQALSNVTYTGGNAVIGLDGSNSVTLAGVSGGLKASDFQIIDAVTGQVITGDTPTPTPTPIPEGDNIVVGSDDSEIINGLETRDQIYSNGGNDTIHGNGGSDYIDGGNGNDTIYGDSGSDYIFGGSGRDKLIGGSGDDGLTGGSGNDKFIFYKNNGNDWLNDFQNPGDARGDVIQISSEIYSTKSQILSNIEYNSGNAVIHLDNNNSVTLADVSSGLTASDFQII